MRNVPLPFKGWSGGLVLQVILLAVLAAVGRYAGSMLSPLQEVMQRSLALTDKEVSLVQGLALALPLAIFSIPIGMAADRISRLRLILLALGAIVIGNIVVATAKDFEQLFLARCLMGAAIPAIPIALYSIASDLIEEGRRGRAFMIIGFGEQLGAPAAFMMGSAALIAAPFLGSELTLVSSWGVALLIMSVVFLPAIASLRYVRDPARAEASSQRTPLKDVLPLLWSHRSVAVPLQVARATLFIAEGAVFIWGAPLFTREFQLSTSDSAVVMGIALLVCGVAAPIIGGYVVDFYMARGGPRPVVSALTIMAFCCIPCALFPLASNTAIATILLTLFLVIGMGIATAALALTTIVIPAELRGVNIAVSFVIASVFFVGLAPFLVATISASIGGPHALGTSLAIVCAGATFINAVFLFCSLRNFGPPANIA